MMFREFALALNPATGLRSLEGLKALAHQTGDNLGGRDVGVARRAGDMGFNGKC